jgi:hypothetical protein
LDRNRHSIESDRSAVAQESREELIADIEDLKKKISGDKPSPPSGPSSPSKTV